MNFAVALLFSLTIERAGASDEGAPSATADRPGEVRDVFLMLDDGPVHLRMHLALRGRALSAMRSEYIDRLITTLDANGDGELTRSETDRSPLLRKKQRPGARKFLESLGTRQRVSRRDVAQTVQRVGGETVVYRQDSEAAKNDDELFMFLDSDRSGVLGRKEILSVERVILEKDGDGDECVSFQELLPEREEPPADPAAPVPIDIPEPPTARLSMILRDADETLLPRRVMTRYDRNRDRTLSPRELGWSVSRLAAIDASGDNRLDEREIALLKETAVDVELAVDLDPRDGKARSLRVLHVAGGRVDVTEQTDVVRIRFNTVVVTFARRYVDPVLTARDNAMTAFNQMDGDANGYLEKEETMQRTRFARGLFETIDADGDGKLFGEEMENYVRIRGEPNATSCRVNVYDTGHGFFMALDGNGDGRIGVRERRLARRSLSRMERDGREGIAATEPMRHFRIEFVRGSYQMFGPLNQTVARTAPFQQRAIVGPVWFQRMDRNGDGDVGWREFVGYRDVFNQLDVDHD
ncbi:MAG: hypothetical protein CMJ48_01215, partial [Planctomycetaceae bacterium]|nr:hypothetical protein [Planctomycetaceae bacterium]